MSGSDSSETYTTPKSRARRFLIGGVDLGNGEPVSESGMEIRKFRGRKVFWVPMKEALELLARRAQVLECKRVLGVNVKKVAACILAGFLFSCGWNPTPPTPDPCDACTPEQTCQNGVCVDPPGPKFQSMLLRTGGDDHSDLVTIDGTPVEFDGKISCCMPNDWGGKSGWPVNFHPEWQDYSGGNFFHARLGPFLGSKVAEPEWTEIGGPYLEQIPDIVDLNQWNPAFWETLKAWLDYAGQRGRYVEIDIIDGWNCKHGMWGDRPMPWVAANNVQNQNVVTRCSAEEIKPGSVFDNWIRKVVTELGPYGNIIWQDGNEIGITGRYNPAWSLSMRDRVRYWEREVAFNMVHLFGTNSNHVDVMTQVDYIEGHRTTPYPHPVHNRLSGVNEYNPGTPYTPEVMKQFLCTAKDARTLYWYWRHNQPLDWMQQTFALWGTTCEGVDTGDCPFETFPPTKIKVSPANDATPLVCNKRVGSKSYCRYVGFMDGRSCCSVRTEGDPTRLACELGAMGGEINWWLTDNTGNLTIHPYHDGFKFRLQGSGTARVRCSFKTAGGEDRCVDGPSGGAIWRTR